MDQDKAIERLEAEWDLETGAIGRVRGGYFDEEAFQRVIGLLGQISLQDEPVVKLHLVQLLCFIPVMWRWNRRIVEARGADIQALDRAIERVELLLYQDVLGFP